MNKEYLKTASKGKTMDIDLNDFLSSKVTRIITTPLENGKDITTLLTEESQEKSTEKPIIINQRSISLICFVTNNTQKTKFKLEDMHSASKMFAEPF